MNVNKINPVYAVKTKQSGDPLTHNEWNEISLAVNEAQEKINDIIDDGVGSGSGSGSGISSDIASVNSKHNLTLGSNSVKNVNIEPGYPNTDTLKYGDIALKPGDDIQFASHHREPKKRDKIVVKNIDGSDNPVKLQVVAGEVELAVGTTNNPKTATKKKDKTTGEDTQNPMFKLDDAKTLDVKILTGNVLDEGGDNERDERGYLKVRAQAIDLRCEKHGGIALQPKGYDSSGNMNKIKFEHGGGDGLEFGTFNTEKTSIYTNEYRFKKDGIWKMATRLTEASEKTIIDEKEGGLGGLPATGAYKYVKQSDDFYDIINLNDEQCTTKDIIKTANAFNGTPCIHTKITNSGNLEIATSDLFLLTKSDTAPSVYNEFLITSPYASFEDGKYYSLSNVITPIESSSESGNRYSSGENIGSVDMEYVRNLFNLYLNDQETITLVFSDGVYYTFTKFAAPNIKIDSGAELKLGGILDFGSSFNFGETDNGIEVQYKLTKKNAEKDCGIIKVIGVNNHATNNLVVEGITIAPGHTEVIDLCSLLDMIKLVNYMKTNNEGPWASQL